MYNCKYPRMEHIILAVIYSTTQLAYFCLTTDRPTDRPNNWQSGPMLYYSLLCQNHLTYMLAAALHWSRVQSANRPETSATIVFAQVKFFISACLSASSLLIQNTYTVGGGGGGVAYFPLTTHNQAPFVSLGSLHSLSRMSWPEISETEPAHIRTYAGK